MESNRAFTQWYCPADSPWSVRCPLTCTSFVCRGVRQPVSRTLACTDCPPDKVGRCRGRVTGSRDIVMILRWDEKTANNIMPLGAAASIIIKKLRRRCDGRKRSICCRQWLTARNWSGRTDSAFEYQQHLSASEESLSGRGVLLKLTIRTRELPITNVNN